MKSWTRLSFIFYVSLRLGLNRGLSCTTFIIDGIFDAWDSKTDSTSTLVTSQLDLIECKYGVGLPSPLSTSFLRSLTPSNFLSSPSPSKSEISEFPLSLMVAFREPYFRGFCCLSTEDWLAVWVVGDKRWSALSTVDLWFDLSSGW